MSDEKNTQKNPDMKHTSNQKKRAPLGDWSSVTGIHRAVPVILVALSLFIAVCYFTQNTGAVGQLISSLFLGLFAGGAYLIPVLLIVHAVFYVSDLQEERLVTRIIFSFISLISVCAVLYAVRYFGAEPEFTFKSFYADGRELRGGGLIGSTIGFCLTYLFDSVGVIIIALMVVALYITYFFSKEHNALSYLGLKLLSAIVTLCSKIERGIKGGVEKVREAKFQRQEKIKTEKQEALYADEFFAVDNGLEELRIDELDILETRSRESIEQNPTLHKKVIHQSADARSASTAEPKKAAEDTSEPVTHRKSVDIAKDIYYNEIADDESEPIEIEMDKPAVHRHDDLECADVFSDAFDPFDFDRNLALSRKASSKASVTSQGRTGLYTESVGSITEADIAKAKRNEEFERRKAALMGKPYVDPMTEAKKNVQSAPDVQSSASDLETFEFTKSNTVLYTAPSDMPTSDPFEPETFTFEGNPKGEPLPFEKAYWDQAAKARIDAVRQQSVPETAYTAPSTPSAQPSKISYTPYKDAMAERTVTLHEGNNEESIKTPSMGMRTTLEKNPVERPVTSTFEKAPVGAEPSESESVCFRFDERACADDPSLTVKTFTTGEPVAEPKSEEVSAYADAVTPAELQEEAEEPTLRLEHEVLTATVNDSEDEDAIDDPPPFDTDEDPYVEDTDYTEDENEEEDDAIIDTDESEDEDDFNFTPIPKEEQNPHILEQRAMFNMFKDEDGEDESDVSDDEDESAATFDSFDAQTIDEDSDVDDEDDEDGFEVVSPKVTSARFNDYLNSLQKQNEERQAAKAESEKPKEKKPPVDYSGYQYPPISLLASAVVDESFDYQAEINENGEKLIDTLDSFRVTASIKGVDRGPRITRYEVVPARGVKVSSITSLFDDLTLAIAVEGVRMEAPIPGKSAIGVEIPNRKAETVYLRDLIESSTFQNAESKTFVCIGKDVSGNPVYGDITDMLHTLVAGASGMGKSVCINSILLSLLYRARPDEVKFIMIDPKKVEFSGFNGIPHLLVPVVIDPKQAAGALMWAVEEMERRYDLIDQLRVKKIDEYNAKVRANPELGTPMSKIIIVIDELNDLMVQVRDPVEGLIMRIAQKARAAGIHLIIGTQRPSVDVITGTIKANIQSRIACKVSSAVDSRTILEQGGAEKLLNKGDMLFYPVGKPKPIRVQGAYVSNDEVDKVIAFLQKQAKGDTYDEDILDEINRAASKCSKSKGGEDDDSRDGDESSEGCLNDQKFLDAVNVALNCGKISTSLLQRKVGLGFGRAARYIDFMEDLGVVSEKNGQKPRDVLITKQEWMDMLARRSLD